MILSAKNEIDCCFHFILQLNLRLKNEDVLEL